MTQIMQRWDYGTCQPAGWFVFPPPPLVYDCFYLEIVYFCFGIISFDMANKV